MVCRHSLARRAFCIETDRCVGLLSYTAFVFAKARTEEGYHTVQEYKEERHKLLTPEHGEKL
jgi:hypothetical protein